MSEVQLQAQRQLRPWHTMDLAGGTVIRRCLRLEADEHRAGVIDGARSRLRDADEIP